MTQRDDRYRGNNGNFRPRKGNTSGCSNNSKNNSFQKIEPMQLPEEYVDEAGRVIAEKIMTSSKKITTSKLRNILSIVSDIYNVESRSTKAEISEESYAKLQMLRIRVLYECGRYRDEVKPFVEESHLLEYMKGIGRDREKFIRFEKYMEALVAFHRYYGGKEY